MKHHRTHISILTGALAMASLFTGCQTAPQAQDPFDVALGLASLNMMNDGQASDDVVDAFARATAPVPQQTIINQTMTTPATGGVR